MLIEVVVPTVPRRPPTPPPVALRTHHEVYDCDVEAEFYLQADGSVYASVMSVSYKSDTQRWHFACSPGAVPGVLIPEIFAWLQEFVIEGTEHARKHFAGV